MILRFQVENFRSIRDSQEISLIASNFGEMSDSLLTSESFAPKILPVCAIYGANASGKTTVLSAMEFFVNAVRLSQFNWDPSRPIQRSPFMFGGEDRPSSFEAEFLLKGKQFRYGFKVTELEVIEEWLYSYEKSRQQKWFFRKSGNNYSYGKSLRKFQKFNNLVEGIVRKNSLFLSAAAQNNHELLTDIYAYIGTWNFVNKTRSIEQKFTSAICHADDKVKKAVLALLEEADLGIIDIEISKRDLVGAEKEILDRFNDLMPAVMPRINSEKWPLDCTFKMIHSGPDGQKRALESDDESNGTVALFAIAGSLLGAITQGSLVCIDEIESSLHPAIVRKILLLFTSPKINTKGAQLIFNTHDTTLLDNEILRRDEIWFSEKDRSAATHIYPLSDFKVRKGEKLEAGYLKGRYGAIPFLTNSSLVAEETEEHLHEQAAR